MSCCASCAASGSTCGGGHSHSTEAASARSPSWPARVVAVGAFEWPWEREAREKREQRAAYEARRRAANAAAREADRRRARELAKAQAAAKAAEKRAADERRRAEEAARVEAKRAADAAAKAKASAERAAREQAALAARLDEQRRATAEAEERARAAQLEELQALADAGEQGETDELDAQAFPTESVAVAGWSMGGAPGPGGDAWPWPMSIVGATGGGAGKGPSGARGASKGGGFGGGSLEGLGGRLGAAAGGEKGLAAGAPREVREVDDAISSVVEQILPFVPYGDVVREVHEARRGAMYGASATRAAAPARRKAAARGAAPAREFASPVVARLQDAIRRAARGDKAASLQLATLKGRAASGDPRSLREWSAAVAAMRADDEATERAYVAALARGGRR